MRKDPRQEVPSSDPSGHLLPAGAKGMCRDVSVPSSPQRGEGARRADEGATPANCAENEKRAHGFRRRPSSSNGPVQMRLSMSFDMVSTGMSPE
ncbi:hypothetical protein CO648_05015 [Rhizobium phaseoli]|nr:hypothetical protein CO648_05015 [Rhizobium phaseoli]